jgi:hypothetical protein
MILKVYQIVIIDNVRFVKVCLICQDCDSVYLNIYKKERYLYSFKNYLYILYIGQLLIIQSLSYSIFLLFIVA